MLSLDDPRWLDLKGGYRVPFDPRPLLARLQAGQDPAAAWKSLWTELYHQGDVGEASYAAVPHLVRIHRESPSQGSDVYGLVAAIELARDARGNPGLPDWGRTAYEDALRELAALGARDVLGSSDPESTRCILAVLAIAKGARVYGRLLLEFTEDEVRELEAQAFGGGE